MSIRPPTLLLPSLLLTFLAGNVRASDTIVVPPGRFQVDHGLHLIVTNLPADQANAQWPEQKSAIEADAWYAFTPAVDAVATGQAFTVADADGTPYQLYFTDLPLISITTAGPIVDEPRIHGHFSLAGSSGQTTTADLGIEYRGGSSQNWPKKSYRLEFWNDTTGDEELDQSLLGMRSDDDWNLLPLYNEPLRLRNVVCNRLWRTIHAPYYHFLEPDAVNGVRMAYAELFLNGAYQGTYAVSERIDRKQLKLKKYNGSIRGQLYKGADWGAPTLTSAPPYNNNLRTWHGFEYEYPQEVTDWSGLHDFADFVVNEPEADFLAGYAGRFELDNAVDYFIFLNLLRATDNTGKNIFIAMYDTGTPYFYVPHDLDGTFGIAWDGTPDNVTTGLLLNGFYSRLMHDCRPDGFTDRLRQRWNALRTDIITHDNILGLFQQENGQLAASGAYQREMLAWPDYVYDASQLDYLSTWLTGRIAYLDGRFNAPCEPSGIPEFAGASFSMYPNPATGHLMVTLDAPGSPAELRLMDPLGRTVLDQVLTGERSVIDLAALGKGPYLVQVRRNERTTTEKLVIR